MRSSKKGFTLVELLVVIGIIAVLISILLPSLQKAKDQANTTVCQSNMRQFYTLMMEYAADYNQAVLPARLTVTNAQYYWWSPGFIGKELYKSDLSNSAARNIAEQQIVKILTCPSADHTYDPAPDNGGTNYWGDYTYNNNLGDIDLTTTPVTIKAPFETLVRVPGNVIVMTDIDKAYYMPNVGVPSGKWETNISMFLQMNYLLGNHQPAWGTGTITPAYMWFPHHKNTQANVLSMDGHVTINSPNDFILPDQLATNNISTKTIPWTYTPSTPNMATRDYLVGYYKYTVASPWVTPWDKNKPPL